MHRNRDCWFGYTWEGLPAAPASTEEEHDEGPATRGHLLFARTRLRILCSSKAEISASCGQEIDGVPSGPMQLARVPCSWPRPKAACMQHVPKIGLAYIKRVINELSL